MIKLQEYKIPQLSNTFQKVIKTNDYSVKLTTGISNRNPSLIYNILEASEGSKSVTMVKEGYGSKEDQLMYFDEVLIPTVTDIIKSSFSFSMLITELSDDLEMRIVSELTEITSYTLDDLERDTDGQVDPFLEYAFIDAAKFLKSKDIVLIMRHEDEFDSIFNQIEFDRSYKDGFVGYVHNVKVVSCDYGLIVKRSDIPKLSSLTENRKILNSLKEVPSNQIKDYVSSYDSYSAKVEGEDGFVYTLTAGLMEGDSNPTISINVIDGIDDDEYIYQGTVSHDKFKTTVEDIYDDLVRGERIEDIARQYKLKQS